MERKILHGYSFKSCGVNPGCGINCTIWEKVITFCKDKAICNLARLGLAVQNTTFAATDARAYQTTNQGEEKARFRTDSGEIRNISDCLFRKDAIWCRSQSLDLAWRGGTH